MKNAIFVCVLMSLVVCTGCATAFRGTKQTVTFHTDPPDAIVNVDGTDYPAPAEVVLGRREQHVVTVSAPGYQPVQFDFQGKLDPMTLGQLAVPGGSILLGTDVASGGANQYNKMATIRLEKTDTPTTQPIVLYEWKGRLITKDEVDRERAQIASARRREMDRPKLDK